MEKRGYIEEEKTRRGKNDGKKEGRKREEGRKEERGRKNKRVDRRREGKKTCCKSPSLFQICVPHHKPERSGSMEAERKKKKEGSRKREAERRKQSSKVSYARREME